MLLDAFAVVGLVVAAIALSIALGHVLVSAFRADRAAGRFQFHLFGAPLPQPAGGPPVERGALPSASTTRLAPAGNDGGGPATSGPAVPASNGNGAASAESLIQSPLPDRWPAPEAIQVAEPLAELKDHAGTVGFYREVAGLLTAELQLNPARLDLHRKLLEVYGAAALAEEFVQCARAYLEQCQGVPDEHWPGIAKVGRDLLPGHELFASAAHGKNGKRFQRFYEAVNQTKLHNALNAVTAAYDSARQDPAFSRELFRALADGLRRPTPLTLSPSGSAPGPRIYVKREDGRGIDDDQRINALGQCLMALRMQRRTVVTATHDGRHGLAVATVAARLRLGCVVWMTEADYRQHYARVLQMRQLSAGVRTVPGHRERDAARLAALQHWLDELSDTHFVSSLAMGPHPYPLMVREFQSVVGQEAALQLHGVTGGAASAVVAGIADGYVGLGLLNAFLTENAVPLYCVEPAHGPREAARHQLREHSWLRESRRVRYVGVGDDAALKMVEEMFNTTGLSLSTETGRTLAYARQLAASDDAPGRVLTVISRTPEATPAL